MENYKAIPNGYMTVGQLAKRMGTTVRTLQYYDKEGVLIPSAESEGGRRLYTDKDMIKLHFTFNYKRDAKTVLFTDLKSSDITKGVRLE